MAKGLFGKWALAPVDSVPSCSGLGNSVQVGQLDSRKLGIGRWLRAWTLQPDCLGPVPAYCIS